MKKSIVLLLSLMFLVGCSGNIKEESSNAPEPSVTVETAVTQDETTNEIKSPPSLAQMTGGDFKNQFNAVAKKYDLDRIQIKQLNREFNDDTTMTFNYDFNEKISMIIKTDSALKIDEVLIVSNGDISKDTDKTAIAVLASAVMTVNKDYEIEDVNEMFTRLGWLADNSDPMNFNGSLDEKGILYRIKSQDSTLTFDIKPSPAQSSSQSNNDFNGIVTIDEFKDNFKKLIDENTLSIFNIDNLEIKEESAGGGTFNLMFKDTIALTGAFNPDRKIAIASLLVTGDGTETTGQDIIVTMGMFVMATNPSYSISDAEEVLTDLGMDQNSMEKIAEGSSVIRNGVRYNLNFVKDTKVIMLSARNANDQ